ncbi:MAG: hypothetical protein H7281_15090 [Bacteriovorax sp.]|nr:hypothetical protein [Bacteriovorax sp.]
MNKDILLWSNIEIINALDKWGVLTLRSLHKQLTSNISIHGLRRKIHRLAIEEFVYISRLDNKNEMIILPTKKTLNHLKSPRSSIDESMVYHNLFISILGIELMNRENVHYYKLPHEYQTSRVPNAFSSTNSLELSLSPDAYLGISHNDKIFKVAIEVELTQKSSDRVYEKFIQYKESTYFDYVIYFFKSKSILNSYRRRIQELIMENKSETSQKGLNGKIIFLYSSQNHQYGSILANSTMECATKELSIEKFFGEEIVVLDLSKKKEPMEATCITNHN